MLVTLETDVAKARLPLKKLPTCITSFNWTGWERYGKRFIESWKEFAPPNIKLIVYYEGEQFEDFLATNPPTGVSWRPIEEVEFLQDFLGDLRFPIMHGIVGSNYDINFDARQARKAFMEVHSARKLGGKIFWLDADSVLKKNIPESFFDQCLPDDKFSCFLGRDGWYFTESGFIGFNADHPIAKEFFKNYLHILITGVIFAQAPQYDKGALLSGGWHDCIAFDCSRELAYRAGMQGEFVNLAKDVPVGTMHPMANCAPGQYIDHLKGDRKDTGVLKKGDVIGQ